MPHYDKKPKCPKCLLSSSVIKWGRQLRAVRYLCKGCGRSFSKNYTAKPEPEELLNLYLDGVPLRKIAHEKNTSAPTVYRKCSESLKKLPNNNALTRLYCNRFSGYLVFDGKYVAVKGYSKKVVLLWGIDYLTHDIPVFHLAPSESYLNCLQYFNYLKSVSYPLKYLVCDDNEAAKMAARYVYPKVIIQTCLAHYKENIRRDLGVRSTAKYKSFVREIEILFEPREEFVTFTRNLFDIYTKYKDDTRALYWIQDIMDKRGELLAYNEFHGVPRTTNLAEAYNSHLQARLKSIKGFQSFSHARAWLNGYILRRRLKPFTDCTRHFKHLNGKCSLEKTIKKEKQLPKIF